MRSRLTSLFVMALLAAAPGIARAADSVAVIGMLQGSATATDSTGAAHALKAGDPVYLDEEIATAAGSKLQIMLKDKSSVMLSANSKLKVREFAYDTTSHDGKLALQEMKGAFRFIGGALSKKTPITIETPVSSIGIRGGVGDTFIGANGATESVFIYGEAMSMTNADGKTVTTTSYGSGLSMNTPHDTPASMSADQVQQRLATFGTVAPELSKGAANTPDSKKSSDAAPVKKDETTATSTTTEKKDETAATADAPAAQDTSGTASTDAPAAASTTASNTSTQPATDTTSTQPVVDNTITTAALSPSVTTTTTTPLNTLTTVTGTTALTQTTAQVSQTTTQTTAIATQAAAPLLKGMLVTTSGPTGSVTMHADKLALTADTAPGGGAILVGQRGQIFPTAGTALSATNIPAPDPAVRGYYDYGSRINIINAGAGTGDYLGTGFTSESGGTVFQQFIEKYPSAGMDPMKLSMLVGNQVEGAAANQAMAATIAKSHTETTGDLAYYRFLPNLSNGNPNNNGLAFFDYGHRDVNPNTTTDNGRASPLGLAVNWQNKQFLSGDLHWDNTGSSGMNRDGVIAFGSISNATGHPAFDGIGFSTSQNGTLLPIANNGGIDIGQQTALYRNPGTSGEIEALLMTAQATDPAGNLLGDPIYQPAFRVDALADARLQAIDESRRGTATTPVTNYQGFSAGIGVHKNGVAAPTVAILQSTDIHDVNIRTNSTTSTVGAELKLHETPQPWNPGSTTNQNTITVDFGTNPTASQGSSAYLSNDLYAAEHASSAYTDAVSSTTTVVSGTTNNNGFIANAAAINDVPAACTTCDFVHWGVWSTDITRGTGAAAIVDHAVLVPYVAGTVTPLVNVPNTTGTVNYTGPMFGQYYDATGNSGQGALTRETGSFTAGIDLGNRALNSFDANFAGLTIQKVGGGAVPIGTNGTTAVIDPFQISGGGSIYGSVNGALFGPHAENVGGNFALSDTAHTKEAAGVFLGAR